MTARAWLVLAERGGRRHRRLPAQAHNAGISTSRIVIRGRTVDAEINALGARLRKGGRRPHRRDSVGRVNAVALAVMAPALLGYVGDHVAVLAGDRRCEPRPGIAKRRRHPCSR